MYKTNRAMRHKKDQQGNGHGLLVERGLSHQSKVEIGAKVLLPGRVGSDGRG